MSFQTLKDSRIVIDTSGDAWLVTGCRSERIPPTPKSSTGCNNWNYVSNVKSPLFFTSTGKWVVLDEWKKIELEQSITENSITAVPTTGPLPPGWGSKTSSRWGGARYYYHPDTQTTQWDVPTWPPHVIIAGGEKNKTLEKEKLSVKKRQRHPNGSEMRKFYDERAAKNKINSKKNLFCPRGSGVNGNPDEGQGGPKVFGCGYYCRKDITLAKHAEKCKWVKKGTEFVKK
jgi:hypothetical protein